HITYGEVRQRAAQIGGIILGLGYLDITPKRGGWALLFALCAVGIGGTFQYGYNLSIINAPTKHIQKFVKESWMKNRGSEMDSQTITLIWSIIVSMYPLGGFIGGLLAGPMAIRLGRKSLVFSNLLIVLSALLCGFSRYANCFVMIILGRVLSGVSSGVSMNIQTMYLEESEPKNRYCTLALSYAVFTALGTVLGQLVGLREILGSEELWPLLLASNVVPAILQILCIPWLPDVYAVALQRLSGNCDCSSGKEETIVEQATIEAESPKGLFDLVRDPSVRKQLLTVAVLSSAMQLCGNDSIYFYASSIFEAAGIPSEMIQYVVIGLGSCELLTSIISILFIHRIGRRVLVIGGYSLMSVWAVVFMVALSYQAQVSWIPYVSMVCIFAYILTFGIGPAGVTDLLPAEIFDPMARPAAYMICDSLMWIMLFVVGMAFPFIVHGLGHFYYIPFLVVCVCTALYAGFFLPETGGKREFSNHGANPHDEDIGRCGPQEIKSAV
ncbi:solute carrier family 2, facilitated glucose transporter member 11-like, partial [Mixophyes fleayi]|uniref:solute carrier family 2, facilitated glucose transporter member 11-like n=1 Tax=Mixophyes fleayi TaxID=3061075 RepID=UPI003F4DD921